MEVTIPTDNNSLVIAIVDFSYSIQDKLGIDITLDGYFAIRNILGSRLENQVIVLEKIHYFKAKLEKTLNELVGHSYARDIANFLYEHPFFVQAEFEKTLDVSYVTSRKYLLLLEREKVVMKKKQERRNRFIFACPEYIMLLKKS